MKRFLLASFAECPENLHLEARLAGALLERGAALDCVHDYRASYPFIKLPSSRRFRRHRYAGRAGLAGFLAPRYDALLLLDFPKRQACAEPFLRLSRDPRASSRIFLANHLLPVEGQNIACDAVRRTGLLRSFGRVVRLRADDWREWDRLCGGPGRSEPRDFCIDCGYYSPGPGLPGRYVFSAGSAGRDFGAAASAAARLGVDLLVFTDSPPAGRFPRAVFEPLSPNLHRLRDAVRGAAAVVVPVAGGHRNYSAGNSLLFMAMACGRPAVTRRNSYMLSVVRDGSNGFLYAAGRPASLASALRRALSLPPAGLRRLTASARASALKKASLEKFCASLAAELSAAGGALEKPHGKTEETIR